MSSIKLTGDAWNKLADIKRLARSSSSTIAGNIGMFNGRAIKFNTHIGERLTSSTTSEMRLASSEMRKELSGIVDELFKGNDDKITKLKQMFDSENKVSLLERKVVASVIEEIEKDGGRTLDVGDLEQYSSEHKKTTFDVVSANVEKDVQFDMETAAKADNFAKGMKTWIKSALENNGVTLSEVESKLFDKFLNSYTEELKKVGVTEKNGTKLADFEDQKSDVRRLVDNSQVDWTKRAMVFLARLAMGGKELPNDFVYAKTFDWRSNSKAGSEIAEFTFVKEKGLDIALKLAKGHEGLFARLLAHCSVPQCVQIFNQLDEAALTELENASLDNSSIYERLVGSKPTTDVGRMTSAEFIDKCKNDAISMVIENKRAFMLFSGKQSLTEGTGGILVSPEIADKMLNREAKVVDGKVVNYSLKDLKLFGQGYSVLDAQKKEWKEIVSGLQVDYGRLNKPVYNIFGTKIDSTSNFVDEDTVGEKVLGLIRGNTTEYTPAVYNGISKIQAHVAGLMLGQAGLAITNGLLINDQAAGEIETARMTFKLESQGDDVVLSIESQKREDMPYLSYAFTIKRDGTNELSAFEYSPTGWNGGESSIQQDGVIGTHEEEDSQVEPSATKLNGDKPVIQQANVTGKHIDVPLVVVPEDIGELGSKSMVGGSFRINRSYDINGVKVQKAENAFEHKSWGLLLSKWLEKGVGKEITPREFCSCIVKAIDRYSQDNNAFFASGTDAMKRKYTTFMRNLNFLIEDELKAEINPNSVEDDEFDDYEEKPFKQRMVKYIRKEIEETLPDYNSEMDINRGGMDSQKPSVKKELLEAFDFLKDDLKKSREWIED